MARPNKQTLDYFQHDTDASNKKTLRILYNHFRHEGISLWWQLLENISVNRNLVIDCKNYDIVEDLAAKMHFSPERLTEMINKLAELEAIDKPLWEQERIIWCQNLVDRHEDVFKRWKNGAPQKPQLMLAETPENDTETPQIKRNKNKLKENKLKKQFDLFWNHYPKKVAKIDALKAFNKLDFSNGLMDTIIIALEKQKQLPSWTKDNGQFIPNPATWLNQNRWEDEVKNGKPAEETPYTGR